MTDRGLVPRPDLMLSAIAADYLRNPVRSIRVTACRRSINNILVETY